MDSWEGPTLPGDLAQISRTYDLVLGEVHADNRQFRVVAFGDFGLVAEVNPAFRENSRWPQEMARAKLAHADAAREAALNPRKSQPLYSAQPPQTISPHPPPAPSPPPPSKEKECESGLQMMSRLKTFESYRQPPHFQELLAQWHTGLEADLIQKQCRRPR